MSAKNENEGATPEPPQSFEAGLDELESIVERLEAGELSLDESVAAFVRGTDLLKNLNATLNEAEKRVQTLMARDDGDIVEGELEDEDPT